MTEHGRVYQGDTVYVDGELKPAAIVVKDGKIEEVWDKDEFAKSNKYSNFEVVNVGTDVLMPGVVDSHVHVNEPGRTSWEGYETATKAAAAGGVTTIVDMPLNSIPSTTSLKAFQTKLQSANGKCHVDVGFWGGIVPGNQDELLPMLEAGVAGFKCFLIHSGVDDFPAVTRDDLDKAFTVLQGTNAVVLFHAEVDCCNNNVNDDTTSDPKRYDTFLKTRPDEMETKAIEMVCELCLQYRVRCHIVHLSAANALPLIAKTRQQGAPLTVETTFHYLCLEKESIPDGATEFKCCPPIRNARNQSSLWQGIIDGHIDMVVSDHSPCTPDLKHLEQGDFLTAWGGISSLQFGLSLMWTYGGRRGLKIPDLARLLCENTARLGGIGHRKGKIAVGYDADFVVWNPDKSYKIDTDGIHHKNKVTPYLGQTLQGTVTMTILRGVTINNAGAIVAPPRGEFLLVKQNGGQEETIQNERASMEKLTIN